MSLQEYMVSYKDSGYIFMENSYKNYRVKTSGQMFPSLNQSNACVCWALQITLYLMCTSLFTGLLQKRVQVMMMTKLIVGQKVICQQVKIRIVQKMGYQFRLHWVMGLTSSGIGYRRKCSRLLATSTLRSLYLQMDPN